jgi:hypothetical protein
MSSVVIFRLAIEGLLQLLCLTLVQAAAQSLLLVASVFIDSESLYFSCFTKKPAIKYWNLRRLLSLGTWIVLHCG